MSVNLFLTITFVFMPTGAANSAQPHRSSNEIINDDVNLLRKLLTEQCPSVLKDALIELDKKHEARGSQAYVAAMYSFLGTVRQSEAWDEPAIRDLIIELAKKVVDKNGEGEVNAQCLAHQFAVFFGVLGDLDREDMSFAEERSSRAEQLLEKWQILLGTIAELSKFDPENGFTLELWQPPPGYKGLFVSGMKPEAITDLQVREEYRDYLRKRDELLIGRGRLHKLRSVRDEHQERVVRFLADLYNAGPADHTELIRLVKNVIQDEAAAQEMIQEVKSAIK